MDIQPIYISLKVAVMATFFVVIISVPLAWYFTGTKKISGIVDGIIMLPMVLPPTVVGFFLLLTFGKNGFLGKVLAKVGVSVVFTWQGAAIAAFVVAFPLLYRAARGAFEQIDKNLIYSARTLGMSERRIFLQVVVPISKPGILAGVILSFARAFGEFGATIMMAGNIKGKTETLSIAVYSAVQSGNKEQAFILALVMVTISFLSVILLNFVIVERVGKK